jgi:predicted nucleic acid-binding protein
LKYLLDTDVVSQLTKEQPRSSVVEWIDAQDEQELFLSVATLLEIRVGVQLLDPGRKRERLERWLIEALPERFEERMLPVERHAADLAGRIIVRSQKEKWGMDSTDAIIGATAMVNDMALATLNVKHFQKLGVELVKF